MKDGETSQDSSQVWQQYESSSGDEDSPQCAICLARLKSQDVGTPDTCDHTFCLDCLLEWSKVSDVDAQKYQKVPPVNVPLTVVESFDVNWS